MKLRKFQAVEGARRVCFAPPPKSATGIGPRTMIRCLTKKRACEGGVHVEFVLEVFGSERSEASD